MNQEEIDNMVKNSRELSVTVSNPDGSSETYVMLLDACGICFKYDPETDELENVDFDFIPEHVLQAAYALDY